MKLKIKKLHPDAKMPTRATDGSVGYDLYAVSETVKMELTGPVVEYDTGIGFEIPEGFFGDVRPRSSVTTKTTLMLGNSAGVIDPDYRGSVKFQFRQINPVAGKKYKVGDRIGQIVFTPCIVPDLELSDELSETDRDSGGFGSSGT